MLSGLTQRPSPFFFRVKDILFFRVKKQGTVSDRRGSGTLNLVAAVGGAVHTEHQTRQLLTVFLGNSPCALVRGAA